MARGTSVDKWAVIDFGLSRRWCDVVSGSPVPSTKRRGVVGTGRYASLSNHMGEMLGRRDDIESLALTLAYLHEGRLPWSDVSAPTKNERFSLMLASKQLASPEAIMGTLPDSFSDFLRAARRLRHNEKPDYAMLRALLQMSPNERMTEIVRDAYRV